MHMTESNDERAMQNSKNSKAYHRKGWIGFVWGYKKFIETVDWSKIKWGKNGEKSGAKSIDVQEDGKIVYRY